MRQLRYFSLGLWEKKRKKLFKAEGNVYFHDSATPSLTNESGQQAGNSRVSWAIGGWASSELETPVYVVKKGQIPPAEAWRLKYIGGG